MHEIREKYYQDPDFHALVDTLEACIHRCDFSASEVRQAATLAAVNYEMKHLRHRVVIPANVDSALDTLHEWRSGEG